MNDFLLVSRYLQLQLVSRFFVNNTCHSHVRKSLLLTLSSHRNKKHLLVLQKGYYYEADIDDTAIESFHGQLRFDLWLDKQEKTITAETYLECLLCCDQSQCEFRKGKIYFCEGITKSIKRIQKLISEVQNSEFESLRKCKSLV